MQQLVTKDCFGHDQRHSNNPHNQGLEKQAWLRHDKQHDWLTPLAQHPPNVD
jgi:hypothetical protein